MPSRVRGRIRVDAYGVVARAVEEGVACGYRRSRKYVENPDEAQVTEAIYRAVMDSLSEVLRFDGGSQG